MIHKLLWKPTLAVSLPLDREADWDRLIPWPVICSPKADGVRAMVQDGLLVGRSGKPIANIQAQAKFAYSRFEGLDGELTVGKPNAPDVFARTTSVCNSRDKDARLLRFNVFDMFAEGVAVSHVDRLRGLRAAFKNKGLNLVDYHIIRSKDQLLAYEDKVLAQGYEGVMLRRFTEPTPGYMQKRSTLNEFMLVRLKRFEFGEAFITEVHFQEHNKNEGRTSTGKRSTSKAGMVQDTSRIGSVTLWDAERELSFNMTVGGDKLQTWSGWAQERNWKGKCVRYKYQAHGTIDKPRIASCTFAELGVE